MEGPPTIPLAWSKTESPVLVPTLAAATGLCAFLFVMALRIPELAVGAFFPLLVSGTALYFRAGRRRGGRLQFLPNGALQLNRGLRWIFLARDEVTAVRDAGPGTLRLDTRSGRAIRLGLLRDQPAEHTLVLERLLAHLELQSGQRAASMAMRPFLGAFTCTLLAFVALEMALAFALLLVIIAHLMTVEMHIGFLAMALAALPLVLAPYVGRRLAHSRITVGDDGVLLERSVFRQVLTYRELASVDLVDASGIRLVPRFGPERTLFAYGHAQAELAEIVRRIRVQIARYAANAEPTADALARGDRSMADWRHALGQLARGGGSYRAETMAPDVLERVVADAAAPLDRRVGAALALREVDPTAITRFRLAAEGSAEPRVRFALEAAAAEYLDEVVLDSATRPAHAHSGVRGSRE
jgi:hypothetical protein